MGGVPSKKLGVNCSESSVTAINQVDGIQIATHNDAYDYYMTKLSQEVLKIQLLLAAEDLPKSCNPIAVVFMRTSKGELKEIDRTEVPKKSRCPVWIHPVYIFYNPNAKQPELVFHLYDVDRKYLKDPVNRLKLGEQTFMGKIEHQFLTELIAADGFSKFTLSKDAQERDVGTLIVSVEKTVPPTQAVEMVFRCSKMVNKDPYLRISRIKKGNKYAIHETKLAKNNLNPTWESTHLTLQDFHSKENSLMIECFDYNANGKHKLIGEIRTCVANLEILHNNKRGVHFLAGHKTLEAQIFVDSCTEKPVYRFSDYLENNFQLEFIFAVDLTASSRDSSHQLDAYPQVISEVGKSIGSLNFDKRFPAWGFGGGVQIGNVISHCFNLDESLGETEVEETKGVLSAYLHAREKITLASPASTRFSEVITKAAKHASSKSSCDKTKYSVLLIITAGVHADIKETKDALIEASECPLSILIIGVNGADCKQMEILEAEHKILRFVSWSELQGGKDIDIKQLFSKLPEQFLEYMKSKGIRPRSNKKC
ncbi:hypothetical protein MKW94_012825 [Papaver nudicaule]|uniref:C2 domain-containing protein n=1 Tax=Papaver nudicaule TaxID=74823 RepID=A0AA41RSU3_PAPNU|nr:hypothetical protein [Papaver nudicaule]